MPHKVTDQRIKNSGTLNILVGGFIVHAMHFDVGVAGFFFLHNTGVFHFSFIRIVIGLVYSCTPPLKCMAPPRSRLSSLSGKISVSAPPLPTPDTHTLLLFCYCLPVPLSLTHNIRMYTHTHTLRYTHTHTHTHTRSLSLSC